MSYAQGRWLCEDNTIGIYTEPSPTSLTARDLAQYDGTPGEVTVYVVVTNPYNTNTGNAIGSIGGYEFRVVLPPSVVLISAVLPGNAMNFATAPDFLCGANIPVIDNSAMLITLTVSAISPVAGYVSLSPVQYAPQSVPGEIVITDFNDDFSISVAHPSTGDFSVPVFGFYPEGGIDLVPCGPIYVATDGDDVLGYGSRLAPWGTLGHAIDFAASNDTVLLADGTYTGDGNRDVDLLGKSLVIRSISGDRENCIIDAEYDDSGPGWVFLTSVAGWPSVTIEGITIARGLSGGISLSTGLTGRAFLTLKDCVIGDTRTGVLLPPLGSGVNADNCDFRSCTFGVDTDGGGSSGFYRQCTFAGNSVGVFGGQEDYIVFEDCTFLDNATGANGLSEWAFEGCEFSGSTVAAVRCWWFGGALGSCHIRSCRFYDNPGIGVDFSGSVLYVDKTEVVTSGGIGICVSPFAGTISHITSCTIVNNEVGISVGPGSGVGSRIADTIVAFNVGDGLADSGGVGYANCNVYGNGTDANEDSWLGGVGGNFAKDPGFCGIATGDYGVAANSPCAPSVLHGLIGAGAVACAGIPAPVLLSVMDVLGDQGGEVRLTWYRSGHDEAGSDYPILGYDVYRRVDKRTLATRPAPGTKLLGWDYLLRVPARGDQGYQVVVPTLCDAAADGTPCPTVFLVSAVTEDPLVFFDSLPDSGSSIDNLAPGVPSNLSVAYSPTGNVVSWLAPGDPDISRYELWRTTGAAPGEDPGEPTAVVPQTQWLDSGYTGSAWDQTYWVAAVDAAGNRGPLTEWSSAGVSAVGETDVPRTYALHGNVPNPFNPSTTLRFDLPRTAQVDLAIYDVAGRRVRRLVAGETFPAGRHESIWDGRNDAGLSAGSGVYLYRLDAGEYRETKRMTLVR